MALDRTVASAPRRITAFHEMGHAIVAHFLEHTDPVHKISVFIIPGIAVFIWNVIRSYRPGEAAGAQPLGRRQPRVGRCVAPGRARMDSPTR